MKVKYLSSKNYSNPFWSLVLAAVLLEMAAITQRVMRIPV